MSQPKPRPTETAEVAGTAVPAASEDWVDLGYVEDHRFERRRRHAGGRANQLLRKLRARGVQVRCVEGHIQVAPFHLITASEADKLRHYARDIKQLWMESTEELEEMATNLRGYRP